MGADVGVTCWLCGRRAGDLSIVVDEVLRWVCSDHFEDLTETLYG
jgi:hypothetical protein